MEEQRTVPKMWIRRMRGVDPLDIKMREGTLGRTSSVQQGLGAYCRTCVSRTMQVLTLLSLTGKETHGVAPRVTQPEAGDQDCDADPLPRGPEHPCSDLSCRTAFILKQR